MMQVCLPQAAELSDKFIELRRKTDFVGKEK